MSSTSPVPSEPVDTAWRDKLQQSDRNNEVREISRVLAALEPGATAASKLRLAMQFEDVVFRSASSLEDYRKKLTKRLKKLQKNYKPPPAAPAAPPPLSNKEAVLKELKQTYGETLLYILKHASVAVEEMRKRHGEERAVQLQQHTDSVKTWAQDLGLLPNTSLNVTMSIEHLEKFKDHLERRTENIRAHVVKFADPDRFMSEALAKREEEFVASSSDPSKILAEYTKRRYDQVYRDKPMKAEVMLAEALEAAQMAVPLPTNRDKSQQSDERAALIHLEKMRAASTVLLAYMGYPEKSEILKQKVVSKAQSIGLEGIDFVTKVMKVHRENDKPPSVTLEDAWIKPLVLTREETDVVEGKDASPRKRPRGRPPVIRSRFLLTPNRKTPSNLLLALKRKRAKLVRPPPRGEGSHLILEFGSAFVMTIYFVPLVVNLRAKSNDDAVSATECASWTPLHAGLTGREDLSVWGAKGNYQTLGSVVQERLRDASIHATDVLRQCFASASKATSEFEVEILEATALLEFLQLSRTTYMPDWQDYEGP